MSRLCGDAIGLVSSRYSHAELIEQRGEFDLLLVEKKSVGMNCSPRGESNR